MLRVTEEDGVGGIVGGTEILRKAGAVIFRSFGPGWVQTKERPATIEEEARLLSKERQEKIAQAGERAITAIKANKNAAPWGRILYDLAIADGRIEAE